MISSLLYGYPSALEGRDVLELKLHEIRSEIIVKVDNNKRKQTSPMVKYFIVKLLCYVTK